jgi:hypothetical protein
MFKQANATPKLIMDDDARRAEAQKNINRTVAKFIAYKVGVTVVIAVAAHVIIKKLEDSTPEEN